MGKVSKLHKTVFFLSTLVFFSCRPGPASLVPIPNITGTIKDVHGRPVEGARLEGYELYLGEDMLHVQGISDYQSSMSSANGRFVLVVAPGTYVFVARKRKDATRIGGQITPEDMSSDPSFPVTFAENDRVKKDFVLHHLEGMGEGFALSSHFNLKLGVSGTLVGRQGVPLSGFIVVGNTRKKISRKPDFTSFPSNNKGEFFLPLAEKRSVFYIEVRKTVMGEPLTLSSGSKSLKVTFSGEETYKKVRLTLAQ